MHTRIDPLILNKFFEVYEAYLTKPKSFYEQAEEKARELASKAFGKATSEEHIKTAKILKDRFTKIKTNNELVALCLDLGRMSHDVQERSYNLSKFKDTLDAVRWYILRKIPELQTLIQEWQKDREDFVTTGLPKHQIEDVTPGKELAIAFMLEIIKIDKDLRDLIELYGKLGKHPIKSEGFAAITETIYFYRRQLVYLGYDSFERKYDDIKKVFPESQYRYPTLDDIRKHKADSNRPVAMHDKCPEMFLNLYRPQLQKSDVLAVFEKITLAEDQTVSEEKSLDGREANKSDASVSATPASNTPASPQNAASVRFSEEPPTVIINDSNTLAGIAAEVEQKAEETPATPRSPASAAAPATESNESGQSNSGVTELGLLGSRKGSRSSRRKHHNDVSHDAPAPAAPR